MILRPFMALLKTPYPGYICDFPPQEGEDAVQFANRVKSAIAIQGGLTELPW